MSVGAQAAARRDAVALTPRPGESSALIASWSAFPETPVIGVCGALVIWQELTLHDTQTS